MGVDTAGATWLDIEEPSIQTQGCCRGRQVACQITFEAWKRTDEEDEESEAVIAEGLPPKPQSEEELQRGLARVAKPSKGVLTYEQTRTFASLANDEAGLTELQEILGSAGLMLLRHGE